MIDHLTTHCRQQLGTLFCVREYLGKSGLVTAYKSFVRPVCEYGNVIFMDASAVHLHKLDALTRQLITVIVISSQVVISSQGQWHWPAVQAAGFPLSATTPGFALPLFLSHILPSTLRH